MVPDDFLDDEAQEFLGKLWIELRSLGQRAQAGDLAFLAAGIGSGQAVHGLVGAHGLGDAEALGQDVDQRGVDVVDRGAKSGEHRIGRGVFGHRRTR